MKRIALYAMVLGFVFMSAVNLRAEETVSKGKTVRFDYTLTVNNQVVDTSEGKTPLQYVQGDNMIIPGLEKQMEGMKVGEEKTVTVPASDAYGKVDSTKVIEIAKSQLAPGSEPQKGMVIQTQGQNGSPIAGVIEDIKDDKLVVNFNHPLAGKDLTFKVKIVEIK
jgi:FKBP-type peptidyl-prolyl cis-trans isomerase 2